MDQVTVERDLAIWRLVQRNPVIWSPGSAHMSYLFYGSGDSGARPGHLAPGPEEPRHLVPGSSHMSYLFYGSGDSGARPGHLAPGPEEPRHLDHP